MLVATRRSTRSIVALAVALVATNAAPSQPSPSLPETFSDSEFWEFFTKMSEPGGSSSENFVSNEKTYQSVIPTLQRRSRGTASTSAWGPSRTSPTSRTSSRRWR